MKKFKYFKNKKYNNFNKFFFIKRILKNHLKSFKKFNFFYSKNLVSTQVSKQTLFFYLILNFIKNYKKIKNKINYLVWINPFFKKFFFKKFKNNVFFNVFFFKYFFFLKKFNKFFFVNFNNNKNTLFKKSYNTSFSKNKYFPNFLKFFFFNFKQNKLLYFSGDYIKKKKLFKKKYYYTNFLLKKYKSKLFSNLHKKYLYNRHFLSLKDDNKKLKIFIKSLIFFLNKSKNLSSIFLFFNSDKKYLISSSSATTNSDNFYKILYYSYLNKFQRYFFRSKNLKVIFQLSLINNYLQQSSLVPRGSLITVKKKQNVSSKKVVNALSSGKKKHLSQKKLLSNIINKSFFRYFFYKSYSKIIFDKLKINKNSFYYSLFKNKFYKSFLFSLKKKSFYLKKKSFYFHKKLKIKIKYLYLILLLKHNPKIFLKFFKILNFFFKKNKSSTFFFRSSNNKNIFRLINLYNNSSTNNNLIFNKKKNLISSINKKVFFYIKKLPFFTFRKVRWKFIFYKKDRILRKKKYNLKKKFIKLYKKNFYKKKKSIKLKLKKKFLIGTNFSSFMQKIIKRSQPSRYFYIGWKRLPGFDKWGVKRRPNDQPKYDYKYKNKRKPINRKSQKRTKQLNFFVKSISSHIFLLSQHEKNNSGLPKRTKEKSFWPFCLRFHKVKSLYSVKIALRRYFKKILKFKSNRHLFGVHGGLRKKNASLLYFFKKVANPTFIFIGLNWISTENSLLEKVFNGPFTHYFYFISNYKKSSDFFFDKFYNNVFNDISWVALSSSSYFKNIIKKTDFFKFNLSHKQSFTKKNFSKSWFSLLSFFIILSSKLKLKTWNFYLKNLRQWFNLINNNWQQYYYRFWWWRNVNEEDVWRSLYISWYSGFKLGSINIKKNKTLIRWDSGSYLSLSPTNYTLSLMFSRYSVVNYLEKLFSINVKKNLTRELVDDFIGSRKTFFLNKKKFILKRKYNKFDNINFNRFNNTKKINLSKMKNKKNLFLKKRKFVPKKNKKIYFKNIKKVLLRKKKNLFFKKNSKLLHKKKKYSIKIKKLNSHLNFFFSKLKKKIKLKYGPINNNKKLKYILSLNYEKNIKLFNKFSNRYLSNDLFHYYLKKNKNLNLFSKLVKNKFFPNSSGLLQFLNKKTNLKVSKILFFSFLYKKKFLLHKKNFFKVKKKLNTKENKKSKKKIKLSKNIEKFNKKFSIFNYFLNRNKNLKKYSTSSNTKVFGYFNKGPLLSSRARYLRYRIRYKMFIRLLKLKSRFFLKNLNQNKAYLSFYRDLQERSFYFKRLKKNKKIIFLKKCKELKNKQIALDKNKFLNKIKFFLKWNVLNSSLIKKRYGLKKKRKYLIKSIKKIKKNNKYKKKLLSKIKKDVSLLKLKLDKNFYFSFYSGTTTLFPFKKFFLFNKVISPFSFKSFYINPYPNYALIVLLRSATLSESLSLVGFDSSLINHYLFDRFISLDYYGS